MIPAPDRTSVYLRPFVHLIANDQFDQFRSTAIVILHPDIWIVQLMDQSYDGCDLRVTIFYQAFFYQVLDVSDRACDLGF